MPKSLGAKTQVYLREVVYIGTASQDLTTNIIRRLAELTGDMTARLKSIFVSAGSSN